VNLGGRPLAPALVVLVGSQCAKPACLVITLCSFGVQAGLIFASPVSRLQHLPVNIP